MCSGLHCLVGVFLKLSHLSRKKFSEVVSNRCEHCVFFTGASHNNIISTKCNYCSRNKKSLFFSGRDAVGISFKILCCYNLGRPVAKGGKVFPPC